MPSFALGVMGFRAVAHVEPGAVATYTMQRGFIEPIVRNGVGDVTLSMQLPLAINENLVLCQVQDQGGGAARGNITVEQVSTTQLRVRTFSAGVASDQHFWIAIAEIGPS